jgi:hypothetical protein
MKKVARIHLLVHPGFSADPAFYGEPGVHGGSGTLSRRYFGRAKELSGDELMVAISPAERAEFRRDIVSGAAHAMFLRELHGILRERLVVLSDRVYPGTPDDSGTLALRIARARGFSVSRWVRSVAYGEMLGECVERAADSFNRSARLHRKTGIEVGMTDFGLFYDSIGPETLRHAIEDARRSFPRVEYLCK